MAQEDTTEYTFNRYINLFKEDVSITESENGIGMINLYGRTLNKKEIILEFLNKKYGDEFQFKPDFFAGLSRIEFIRR